MLIFAIVITGLWIVGSVERRWCTYVGARCPFYLYTTVPACRLAFETMAFTSAWSLAGSSGFSLAPTPAYNRYGK